MSSEIRPTLFQTGRVSNILLILLACLVTYLNATNVGFLALDDITILKKFHFHECFSKGTVFPL